MKFLCAKCDEPMKFEEATGPDEGSMSITFGCPKCGNRTILLTNPVETQVVKAFNVHIGGQGTSAGPMESLRGTLTHQRDRVFIPQATTSQQKETVVWTAEAEKRLENVPAFARDMARQAIERYAVEEGHAEITPEVMKRARERSGG